FQQTNVTPFIIPEGVGGFFEFLKGRVVIPNEGSIAQFRKVIAHELIHVFSYSKIRSELREHKILSRRNLPLWFSEGLAEYWSGEWDTQAEMIMRDAVLNGYLRPISEIYEIYGSFLMYKEGQNFIKFLAEKYGEEKIFLIFENFWKREKFGDVLEITVGKDLKELDREWIYYLKKRYFPLLEDLDQTSMTAYKITDKGFNMKPSYFRDTDGNENVVYIGNKLGYTNVYLQRIDDPERKSEILIRGEMSTEFEAFHLFRSKIDISRNRRLAFTTKSGETDILYIYDLDSREIIEGRKFDDLVALSSPAWSPDGSRIAFSGLNVSGNNDIYIFSIRDGSIKKLTNDFYDDRDPSWSPDGSVLVFSSDRTHFGDEGYYNIFSIHISTGSIEYITYGPFNDYSPVWSPDGKYILFYSDRMGMSNLWILEYQRDEDYLTVNVGDYASNNLIPDSSRMRDYRVKPITNFITAAIDPEWTDDGDIIFTGFENFNFQIYRIDNAEERFTNSSEYKARAELLEKERPWQPREIEEKSLKGVKKYKSKYSLDIAQSQVTQNPIFGTSGGAQFALSDILGNNQYYFLIYNNARSSSEFLESFNLAITKLALSRRTNFIYGLYRFNDRRFNWYDGFYNEIRFGGLFGLSYPISAFHRIEASINYSNSRKEWIGMDKFRKAWLISNYLSYIKDNSIWGVSGPIDGERFYFTLGYTNDIKFSNVNHYMIIADVRKYFRITYEITYAARVMWLFSEGSEARRYYIGGSWTLRGYPRFSIWGRKSFLLNNEIRFPFINRIGINFPFGVLKISKVRGALFMDVGNAWENRYDGMLGSFGIGFRVRVGGVLVLRWDIGKRTDFSNIQRGYFKQFFFGWDY
ncbi:MAG: peptidase MA family metallohydrolase, partial [Fidelibacterota bacterium]